MSKVTIKDTRIRVRPSKALLELIAEHQSLITEMPENVAKALKQSGYIVSTKIEMVQADAIFKQPRVNIELLNKLLENAERCDQTNPLKSSVDEANGNKDEEKDEEHDENYLNLTDLRWLNVLLSRLRKEEGKNVFLHNLIESCALDLPKNEIIARNPELEARCQKLREEQQNREYRKMTKNVDATLKNHPEDTIAYQMKSMNSQIIAVLQFVFSVVAGFVFGFLGIELIIGNLEFGFRLLLGIICALVIALAEIYFLAKKLNEYDVILEPNQGTSNKNKKFHID